MRTVQASNYAWDYTGTIKIDVPGSTPQLPRPLPFITRPYLASEFLMREVPLFPGAGRTERVLY